MIKQIWNSSKENHRTTGEVHIGNGRCQVSLAAAVWSKHQQPSLRTRGEFQRSLITFLHTMNPMIKGLKAFLAEGSQTRDSKQLLVPFHHTLGQFAFAWKSLAKFRMPERNIST